MVRENPVYGRGFLLQQANDFMGPSAPPPKDYRLQTTDLPFGEGLCGIPRRPLQDHQPG